MLAFTRRAGESFMLLPDPDLDPNMTVAELFARGPIAARVVEIRGNQVRIGIDAPDEVIVLRAELLAAD